MRRLSLWGLLILVLILAACGGDKDKDNGGASRGSENTPLPTTTATDVPTATTIPIITNPTLPPPATIDVRSPNSNATSGNVGQPTSQTAPIPTRGGGPTLPPTWTPSSGSSAATTPSVAPPTLVIPTFERPAICDSFAPDYERNIDQHFVNTDLTIYWFPVAAEGVIYAVELYDVAGVVVFSTEIPETQITFTGDYFPTRGTYYWTVRAKQNGAVIDCGAIDNEVFVNG